jgi:hypothetical protein
MRNDTKAALRVLPLNEQPVSVAPGAVARFWYTSQIQIEHPGGVWHYKIPPLSAADAERYLSRYDYLYAGKLMRLRVAEGGTIVLLGAESEWTSEPPSQPPGFPVTPRASKAGGD